jgi:hypothetical protein
MEHKFSLFRDPWGQLVYLDAHGARCEGVLVVRAFPLQAPQEGIALLRQDGTELLWIAQLSTVAEPAQSLLREELSVREWIPVIEDIIAVTSFSTPCTWSVRTDRGCTEFVLRAEEDIRRIGVRNALLVTDSQGINYRVADTHELNPSSRKILDRFL